MSAAVNNITEQPDTVTAAVHRQVVRQAAVPFGCMIRNTPERMLLLMPLLALLSLLVLHEYIPRDLPLSAAACYWRCCWRCCCDATLCCC